MTYQASYYTHRCSDGECGGEILERYPSNIVKVRRIAVETVPGKYRQLFDTIEAANAWAEKRGDSINFNAG
jgi:hypothetical protein